MSPDEVASRLEIADLKARYCRGIDRCDLALLESVFWGDATVQYGTFDGPALEFARLTIASVRGGCQATLHVIANTLVDVSGDAAQSETYVIAYHSMASAGLIGDLRFDPAMYPSLRSGEGAGASSERCSFVVGARYLDLCSCHDTRWRIAHRTYVWDWCQMGPANLLFDAASTRSRLPTGRRDADDPSYSVLNAPSFRRHVPQTAQTAK